MCVTTMLTLLTVMQNNINVSVSIVIIIFISFRITFELKQRQRNKPLILHLHSSKLNIIDAQEITSWINENNVHVLDLMLDQRSNKNSFNQILAHCQQSMTQLVLFELTETSMNWNLNIANLKCSLAYSLEVKLPSHFSTKDQA